MDVKADGAHPLREAMAAYPTGVAVVSTCDASGLPFGLTVNSFTSVSLEPPLVLVCIGHASTWHDRLVAAPTFAISVLGAHQARAAHRFAREPSDGRFEDVPWTACASGPPVLDGAVAWLECSRHDVVEAGDHSILIGRVEQSGTAEGPALLFHRGRLRASDA
jgi:flavin reductase (DIM6/NTAB) family NADH-FMN oxidoreductase RutF